MTQILLDMDGVLADFVAGAAVLHGRNPATVDCWDFPSLRWGFDDPAVFWEQMGYAFWAGLPKTPEFDYILRWAENRVGAENVCLLSSPCKTAGCIDGKLAWIKQHLPAYERRYLFGPAKTFAAGPDRLLLDDYGHNVDTFRAAGGRAVLIPRPWNELRDYSVQWGLDQCH